MDKRRVLLQMLLEELMLDTDISFGSLEETMSKNSEVIEEILDTDNILECMLEAITQILMAELAVYCGAIKLEDIK